MSVLEAAYPQRWRAMAVLFVANFMNALDATIVHVAMPSIQADLGATASQIEWVAAGYLLAFAMGLLPFGRLGDTIGRKRVFMSGVTVFTLASLLCGLAPTPEWLIAFRIAQGLGAAALTPQILGIVQVIFPDEEKPKVFGLFGTISSLGSVLGPALGGVLVSMNVLDLSWRPIFLINIPIGLLVLAIGSRVVPRLEADRSLKPDWGGIALSTLATVALLVALIEGPALGWPWWAYALVFVALATGFGFYRWERRRDRLGEAQLMPVSLFHDRRYMLGVVLVAGFFSVLPALLLFMAIVMQAGLSIPSWIAGLAMAPFSVGITVTTMVAGKLPQAVQRQYTAIGAALNAAALAGIAIFLQADGNAIGIFAIALLIAGMGTGVAIAPLFQGTLASVDPRHAGSASGALQAFQMTGTAAMVALIALIFFGTLGPIAGDAPTDPGAYLTALDAALVFVVALFLVIALVAFFKWHGGDRPEAPTRINSH